MDSRILAAALLPAALLSSSALATTEDTEPQTRSNPVVAAPEAIKAELHSGGVGYAHKFDLLPAAGIIPDLALSFSSLTKNTEYGWGWSLNLSKIERSTRKGPPAYTLTDAFEIDGSLLVPDPDPGSNRFHLQQMDHRRIVYLPWPDDRWEVTNPDGTKFLYGSRSGSPDNANSRLDGDPAGGPDTPGNTFRWSLDKVIDPRGNYYLIDYEYEAAQHPVGGGPLFNHNNHPRFIRYSYNDGETASRLRRIVKFEWGTRGEAYWNDDRPTSYRAGFKVQISQRLTDIFVGTDSSEDGDLDPAEYIRRYEMIYYSKPALGGDDRLPPYSQLWKIQRYGKDDTPFASWTEFEYTRPEPGHDGSWVSWSLPAGPGGINWGLIDYKPYDLECYESTYPATFSALADMNGDGFTDAVSVELDPVTCVGTGRWWVAYGPVGPNENLESLQGPNVDMAVVPWGLGTPQPWKFHCGADPAVETDACAMIRDHMGTSLYIADFSGSSSLDLVDMTGDGLPDLVQILGSEWWVHPNLGEGACMGGTAGCFGPPIPWAAPGVNTAASPESRKIGSWANESGLNGQPPQIKTTLVDVNGDGLPDHVTGDNGGAEFDSLSDPPNLDGSKNWVWVSINNGAGFEPAVLLPLQDMAHGDFFNHLGASNSYGYTSMMFADANGDGLADRFTDLPCIAQSRVMFSLGMGWQTSTGPGQKRWDDLGTNDLIADMCEVSFGPDNSGLGLVPEGFEGGGLSVALLDLNGDGINDWYHRGHNTMAGAYPYTHAVWLGLGDGTYLPLSGDPGALTANEPRIPPGLPWPIPAVLSGNIRAERNHVQEGTEGVGGFAVFRMVDLNGDGLLDFASLNDIESTPSDPVSAWLVYLHPGPSGLLKKVTNELGGVTQLDYKPSTWFRDRQPIAQTEGEGGSETHPSTVVRAKPDWVLTSVQVTDGRPSTPAQTQSIGYAELLYDTEAHEYLGARMAESSDAASVVTRQFFHQTADLHPRLEFEEVVNASYEVVRTEKTLWSAPPAVNESGTEIPDAWFPQATQTDTTTLHAGDPNQAMKRIVSRTFDDKTGNLLAQRDWGPDGLEDTGDDYLESYAQFFQPNFTGWLISYPAARSWDAQGQQGLEFYYYDDQALLVAPQKGLITKRQAKQTASTFFIEKWSYDALGNQIEYFDARAVAAGETTPTRATAYDADFQAFPVSITNARQHVTQFAFDPETGEVSKLLDPNGYLRCWAYDNFGRLLQIKHRVGTSTLSKVCNRVLSTFTFVDIGVNPDQQYIEEARKPTLTGLEIRSRRFLDGLGRVYQQETERKVGRFAVTKRGWGSRGELRCESLPFVVDNGGNTTVSCEGSEPWIETTYDALLRPLVIRRNSGGPSELVTRWYDVGDLDGQAGNELIEIRTVKGTPERVVKIGTDTRGNVVAVDEGPIGGKTLLVRDPRGRIVLVDGPDVGSDLNQLSITYNLQDQRTSLSGLWGNPTRIWSYEYDKNGNLIRQISPAGKEIRFAWDKLNRLEVKDYAPDWVDASNPPIDTQDIIYIYDNAFKGIGRLGSVTTPEASGVDTSFSYYYNGNVAAKTRTFPGWGASFQFSYTYDDLGRRLAATLPNGNKIVSEYNGAVLERIRSTGGSGFDETIADGVELHANGLIESITYSQLSSFPSTFAYDPDTHRLDSVLGKGVGGELVYHLGPLTYDLAGNLLNAPSSLPSIPTAEFTDIFTYDPLHRIASSRREGSSHSYSVTEYKYDAAGNLKEKGSLTGLLMLDYSGAHGPHAVTSVTNTTDPNESYTYNYDNDGAVNAKVRNADGSTLNLNRDDDGRIKSLSGAVSASYIYDESGQRAFKDASTSDTLYVDEEYEVDLSASKHRVHFFYGGRRIATENRTELGLAPASAGSVEHRQYYFPDYVGSNAVVVSSDPNRLVQKSFFRPFGEIEQDGDDLSPYLFTDQEHDPESGLQYFGARYYDPWIGRFLSQDPALVGSTAGVTFGRIGSDPQEFNAYSYVSNRPTVRVDPTGEYGRGSGWTDRQWKQFDRAQQRAARDMERRADKLDKKAGKKDEKGESGGDRLRAKAENLRAGAEFLRNDGSDGKTVANLVDSKTFRKEGGSADGAAGVKPNAPEVLLVNKDHSIWSSERGFATGRAKWVAGHESLHSAGLTDQSLVPGGPKAYKDGRKIEREVYWEMKGTPQAVDNPDHLMDTVY